MNDIFYLSASVSQLVSMLQSVFLLFETCLVMPNINIMKQGMSPQQRPMRILDTVLGYLFMQYVHVSNGVKTEEYCGTGANHGCLPAWGVSIRPWHAGESCSEMMEENGVEGQVTKIVVYHEIYFMKTFHSTYQ